MIKTLEIKGLDELQKQLGALDKTGVERLTKAMARGMIAIHGAMPEYPTLAERKKMAFKTAKQRRFFFWALRNGKITVPYVRTGTLQRSVTTTAENFGGIIQGQIGTAIPYAKYVIGGPKDQAKIHQPQWWQLPNIVDENVGLAIKILEDEVAKMLEGK